MENNVNENSTSPTQNNAFVDRQGENLNRRILNIVSQTADKMIVDIEDGASLTNRGTAFNATTLNKFAQGIANANDKADNAVSVAGVANGNADTAVSVANDSNTKAATAKTIAETASTTANTALTTANEAKEKSETALQSSQQANVTANNALDKSEEALQAVSEKQGTVVYKDGNPITTLNADEYLPKTGGTLTGGIAVPQVNAQLKTLILNNVWCNTAANVAAKTAISSGGGTIIPPSGLQNFMIVDVVFENGVGGVSNPTLNIDGTGAKALNVGIVQAGDTIRLIYNQADNSWTELENLTRSQLFREYVRATNLSAQNINTANLNAQNINLNNVDFKESLEWLNSEWKKGLNLWNPAYTPRLEFNASGNSSHSLELNITQNSDGYTDSITKFTDMNETGVHTNIITVPTSGKYYIRIGYNGNVADDKYISSAYFEAGKYILSVNISTNEINHIVVNSISMYSGEIAQSYQSYVGELARKPQSAQAVMPIYPLAGYNANTCYDAGLYLISQGTNLPTGAQFGSLLVIPYRKSIGNSKPDFGTQIFIPNGDDPSAPNALCWRTSLGEKWNEWNYVPSAPGGKIYGAVFN